MNDNDKVKETETEEVRNVLDTDAILLLPSSATATLRYGFFLRLIEKRGDAYRQFRDRYLAAFPTTADRETLYETMTPVHARGLPLIVWLVRGDRGAGVVNLEERAMALIASLTERRISRIALAKHLFLNQRMSTEGLDTLLLTLDEAGIEVEIYE